ncbi:MAG: amidohydrolase family protein [Flavobacteriales bacterium]|nr:amidohydrolase family protein [Flavobacteriales bacterium]
MRIRLLRSVILLPLLWTQLSSAQTPSPAKLPAKAIILAGATAHLGNGEVMPNAAIGMEHGRITFVMPIANIRLNPEQADIIDVTGKHVYPGFINPNSTLGLTEVDAVRASRDFSETGTFNPEIRALIAFNAESRINYTVRSNGVLLTQVTPRDGRIAGTSSIVHLDAWNWEDAVVLEDDGIHVNWPKRVARSGWWAEPGGVTNNEKYAEEVAALRDFLLRAKAYSEQEKKDVNLKMAACEGLFKGSKRLYLRATDAKSITDAVLFAQEIGAKFPVIVGGAECHLVTGLLKERNVPVVLERVHALPANADDHVYQPYLTPRALHEAGVRFCFSYEGDMEAMGARNLPFSAGTAVGHGLPYEAAVKALTGGTAEILGIADRFGTIAEGMDATLFISAGDALDMRTNRVERAFIQGRPIDLDDPHKQLYRKYGGKDE